MREAVSFIQALSSRFLMDFNPDIRLAMREHSLNPQLIAPGIINHSESMSIQAMGYFHQLFTTVYFLSRL
jgi:hypothetical protein